MIFSIQNYSSNLLVLPQKTIMRIEQVMRAFLWKGPGLQHGGAKVAWKDLACPKVEGGVGIRKLEEWNKTCVAKYLW